MLAILGGDYSITMDWRDYTQSGVWEGSVANRFVKTVATMFRFLLSASSCKDNNRMDNWIMKRSDFVREFVESLKNNSSVVSKRETAEGA